MTVQLKRNDTKDTISYSLTNLDGTVVNLTGASVKFMMGKGNTLITGSPATIVDAATGAVSYTLTVNDTLLSGAFQAEFEVTFSDGKIKTFPSDGYISVNIKANIDKDQSTYIEDQISYRVSDIQILKNEIQAQIDQFVIDGTVDQETAQARVEADGTTNTTLKARLDKKEAETKTLLTDNTTKITANTNKITPTMNSLTNNALKAKDGTALIIGCYGDSTYWGYKSGGGGAQIATPAPIGLQNILRSYYNNNNITVNNHGVNGQKSDDIMSTWDATMAATSETIIYFNWGINDSKLEGVTPEHYRSNLRTIIETAQKYGKQVVCDVPNVVLGADSANAGMGDATKNQNVKLYVEIMRNVAREYGCYVIDNYKFTQKYNYLAEYIPISMPDGMHPSDDMYNVKALQMAEPFLIPHCANVEGFSIIPCVDSSVKFFGTSATVVQKNSRSGFALYADTIKVAIFVVNPVDLYLALPLWSKGSTQCQIKLDNNVVNTINLNIAYPGTKTSNMEVLIGENLKPGLHLIELNKLDTSNTTYSVALEYLATRPAKTLRRLLTGNNETNGTFTTLQASHVFEKLVMNNTSGTSTAILDLPTSRLLRNIDVEVTATLNSGDAFFVMGTHRTKNDGTASTPFGGIMLIMAGDNTLRLHEGLESAYNTSTVLSATVYGGSSHKYRLTVSTTGACTIYVDEVQIATYTMTQPVLGGYFGLYKSTTGTLNVDKVVTRQ